MTLIMIFVFIAMAVMTEDIMDVMDMAYNPFMTYSDAVSEEPSIVLTSSEEEEEEEDEEAYHMENDFIISENEDGCHMSVPIAQEDDYHEAITVMFSVDDYCGRDIAA